MKQYNLKIKAVYENSISDDYEIYQIQVPESTSFETVFKAVGNAQKTMQHYDSSLAYEATYAEEDGVSKKDYELFQALTCFSKYRYNDSYNMDILVAFLREKYPDWKVRTIRNDMVIVLDMDHLGLDKEFDYEM